MKQKIPSKIIINVDRYVILPSPSSSGGLELNHLHKGCCLWCSPSKPVQERTRQITILTQYSFQTATVDDEILKLLVIAS